MSNPAIAIPEDRLPELQKAIDKLNKKADKLGTAPITIERGEPFNKKVSETNWATFVPVTINGEAPKLNGWVFVATLEHDENGTLIRRLPTFDNQVDLTQFRKATPDNCDHCGYRRRRNDTYVVWNEATSDTKQVGSSCLKDFIGHDNPEAIAKHLQNVRDLIESVQGGSYSEGRVIPRYDLLAVMAVAAHEVDEFGYVTRKQAWDDPEKISTSEAVRTRWHRYLNSETERVETQKYFPGAENVIAQVRALDEGDLENEYLYNLFTVCKGDSIQENQFGIAASAIKAMRSRQQPEGDGDRHKAEVTHTGEAPTDAQKDYIGKLVIQLNEAKGTEESIRIPGTRGEASDLINDLKLQVKEAREAKKDQPAGDSKASGKQVWRVNKLMEERVLPEKIRKEARAKIDAGLTKQQASKAIEWLETFPEASHE